MNIKQIENLYKINGIDDFKLKSTADLLKVHGIDFKAVDGYNRLDDLSRNVYEKFIVEDIEYLVKEDFDDEFLTVVGGIVNVIDRNGLKYVHQTRIDEAYKHLEIKENETKTYIRFEYEHDGRMEWRRVINEGEEWYQYITEIGDIMWVILDCTKR